MMPVERLILAFRSNPDDLNDDFRCLDALFEADVISAFVQQVMAAQNCRAAFTPIMHRIPTSIFFSFHVDGAF